MDISPQDNPCGLDGFAFIEFSGPDENQLHQQFLQLGFHPYAKHQHAPITWYRQNNIHIFINAAPDTQAKRHAQQHGAGACAMGFRVKSAKKAYERALQFGATPFEDAEHAHHHLLAINAIGGSVIYFMEEMEQPFGNHWSMLPETTLPNNGLKEIDHLTHNVFRGHMDVWAKFYENIFNFQEIRFFNIDGQMTGLFSRALASPCGKIKIPLNESKDDRSQIEEFLQDYQGEGIQHIAYTTENIYDTVSQLRQKEVHFLNVPDTYYEMIQDRVPWHTENLDALQKNQILIDGGLDPKEGLLLQIFTENLFGPVFFEIIQRKGNQGFGEGNFKALFEAIERDQIKRGTL